MTVHGAKGLEVADRHPARNADAQALRWQRARHAGRHGCGLAHAFRGKSSEHGGGRGQSPSAGRAENLRLLYVAMSARKAGSSWLQRARPIRKLLVQHRAGRHDRGGRPAAAGWHDADFGRDLAPGRSALRHGKPPYARHSRMATEPARPTPEPRPPVSPSALGAGKGHARRDGRRPERRGQAAGNRNSPSAAASAVEPPKGHEALARALLGADTDDAVLEQRLAEVRSVLEAPGLGYIFTAKRCPKCRLPAKLVGNRVYGTIDRLLVRPDHVLAIDFKSNRIVPRSPAEVPGRPAAPDGCLCGAAETDLPGSQVETAILWTATAELMPPAPRRHHGGPCTGNPCLDV